MSPSHRIGTARVYSLDTVRGLAMVLVIWQHMVRFHQPGIFSESAYTLIPVIARFAPVAFMFISGAVIAYIFSQTADWKATYVRFIRRAVMFVLVAHPLIRLAGFYAMADTVTLWHYLTLHYPGPDTIAFFYLIAPPLMRRLNGVARILFSLSILIATPIVVHLINPDSALLVILKEILFGQAFGTPPVVHFSFPLLPWLAVGLIGTILGEAMSRAGKDQVARWELTRRMNRIGVALAIVSVVLVAAYGLLKAMFGETWPVDTFRTIYPRNTSALLLLHLALLLWATAWLMRTIDADHRHNRFTWLASVFGRTSLFAYAAQWAVATSLPTILGLSDSLTLPEYFLVTIAGVIACWLICYWYGRMRGWISPDDYAVLSGRMRAETADPPADRKAQIRPS